MYSELVEYLVKAIADDKDAVDVTEEQTGRHVLVEISVAEEDAGRIIGRGGRVINAIRSLAQVVASKNDARISVELLN